MRLNLESRHRNVAALLNYRNVMALLTAEMYGITYLTNVYGDNIIINKE